MTARLGLGLAALGRPGYVTLNHATDLGGRYDPAIMELHAHEVLDAAFAAGIRYIDTARSYGRAEDFVASWLQKRGIEPGHVMVASKWGYTYTAAWSTSAAARGQEPFYSSVRTPAGRKRRAARATSIAVPN